MLEVLILFYFIFFPFHRRPKRGILSPCTGAVSRGWKERNPFCQRYALSSCPLTKAGALQQITPTPLSVPVTLTSSLSAILMLPIAAGHCPPPFGCTEASLSPSCLLCLWGHPQPSSDYILLILRCFFLVKKKKVLLLDFCCWIKAFYASCHRSQTSEELG